jgi:hypothetical protein
MVIIQAALLLLSIGGSGAFGDRDLPGAGDAYQPEENIIGGFNDS